MLLMNQGKNLISIIIVTRNRERETIDCLASIFNSDYQNFEVILIDNASTDETVKSVKEKFAKVQLIRSNQNLGPWKGKNLGEKQAEGEFIFFLDSDTILGKNCLSEMVKLIKNKPKIEFVCPKIYYFDAKDVIWSAGAQVNLLTSQAKNRGVNEKDNGQYDYVSETGYSPTAYLVTKNLAQKLKGHNEKLFMSYGESDYGYRARETGAKVCFCPTAKLWHKINLNENSKSIRALGYNLPLRAYYFSRNRIVFMKRHASFLNFLIFLFVFFPLFNLYITYKIILFGEKGKFLSPHFEGIIDGLKYLFTDKLNNNKWT